LKQFHSNNVTNQNHAREKQLEQIISKQVDDHKKKLFQDELNNIQKKNEVFNNFLL